MGSDTVLQTKKKNGVRSFIIISNCGILKFMARPLRIELAGGLYHVTSRGDRRENIYDSDNGRFQESCRLKLKIMPPISSVSQD